MVEQKPNGKLSKIDKLREFSVIRGTLVPLVPLAILKYFICLIPLAILKSLIFLLFESLPRGHYPTKHPQTQ